MDHNTSDHEAARDVTSSRPQSPWIAAAWMVVAIVAFFILREHWGHVLGLFPYLLLLACPLMHLFMHCGHDHHHYSAPKSGDNE